MLQKLIGIASTSIIALAVTVPDYLALPYICNSIFFFGEPEYPSDAE